MPLNHSTPGAFIDVFIKKFHTHGNDQNTKALWLLQGGPGGSSDVFEPLMQYLDDRPEMIGFDVFYLEHRGVGRSTRLTCTGPQAETIGSEGGVTITPGEIKACAQDHKNRYTDTRDFSTTAAAMDLKVLMEHFKKAGTKYSGGLYLYGISYGTYWASRFMQVGGETLIEALVLDGVMSQAPEGDDDSKRTSLPWWVCT